MSTKADTTGLEYQSAEWFEACAAIKRGQMAGKTVQYIGRGDELDTWSENRSPQWKEGFDYRLAPEPRERWIAVYSDGSEAVRPVEPMIFGDIVDAYRSREVLE